MTSTTEVLHDSMIQAHCFVQQNSAWCYGEIFIIICGLITITFAIWCLYRMFKYQNEAKSAVRSFIMYLSIMLSLLSVSHALFIDGSSLSLTASFLVSVQCSLFTVFFIKICIRTNSDILSINMDCERLIQIIFLLTMNSIEIGLFLYALLHFDENDINCHSPPFTAFACIDVVQILFTIIAVCFIERKIKKQHQKVKHHHNHYHHHHHHSNQAPSSSFIIPSTSPPIQPLPIIPQDEQQSLGQIQMLQKSRQLLLLVIFIFICAVITAVYETWNYVTKEDCSTFIKNNDVINELFRLIARITWLYIPSWLIIYVFWIWPVRPKKYVSDDSLRRREIKKQQMIRKRNRMLNKICCYCFLQETHPNYDDEPFIVNGARKESQNEPYFYEDKHIQRRESIQYNYDTDNRLITENDDDHQQQKMHKTSIGHPSMIPHIHDGDDDEDLMYHRQISDEYDDNNSSSSSVDIQSDIWDQHVTIENIRSGSMILSASHH